MAAPRGQRIACGVVFLCIAGYYLWAALAFNELGPNGYYNYLTRGWVSGQLSVPIGPDQRLLEAANPYDPELPDEWKMHDMVLWQGKYFLYHGPLPVAVLFYPWHKLTGRDLPEPFAVWGFVVLALVAQLLALQRWRPVTPLDVAVLGLSSGVPFLLHRIWVYEVAIAAALATVSVAVALAAWNWGKSAGFVLGLTALTRPHLLLVALAMRPAMWRLIPVGLLLAGWHNWLRFGNPLDFGLGHLIAGPGQQTPALAVQWMLPGLYLFLAVPPKWMSGFPWIAVHQESAVALPAGFFHENMLGALWLAPIVALRPQMWRWGAASGAILLFLSSTGWVSERYLLDFLPLAVLASLGTGELKRWQWPVALFGMAMNVLLHLQGPYNAKGLH